MSIDSELWVGALQVALANRRPPAGCMHHSDGSFQYAGQENVMMLDQYAMKCGISRTGNPYDNAHTESFFRTLKHEETHLSH